MSDFIMFVLLIFSMIGALDKLFGNRLGYGKHFEAGIREMGNFTLSMLGIYCISPIIAKLLGPILLPFSKSLAVDPSIFMGSLLAVDMGGYSSSLSLGQSEGMIKLSGLILSSMLGTTISFNIPMATNLVSKEDFDYYSKGSLCGIVSLPLGVFVGGLMLGLPLKELFINLIPIVVISVLIGISLLRAPKKTIKVFSYLGRLLNFISILGLILSILNFMLDLNILEGMFKFEDGLMVVAKISIVLSGAYGLIAFLSRILKHNLNKISNYLDINTDSILGLFTSLVNAVPMFAIFDKMDWKGQMVNAAFSVGGAYVLGGQLAFVSTVSKESVPAFLVSKLVAGLTAIVLVGFYISHEESLKN